MSQKSSELRAQGVDVINLSVGEPDFNTPDHIKEAAKKAIDDNFSRYSPVPGYPALRNAIVAKLKNENHLEYSVNQISCSNGAKQAVCNTILTLVNPGDEVIIPAPFWVSYPEMVKLAEGKPVIVKAGISQNFKITPAQLKEAITKKTKAMILCSPSNPTGSVYSAEELAALAEVLKQYPDIIVIADEIYAELTWGGKKHTSFASIPELKERLVLLHGYSKAWAMTGFRMAYACAPAWIMDVMLKIHQYTIMCAPTPSQYAALEAMRQPEEDMLPMLRAYEQRRNFLREALAEIGIPMHNPAGAFYAFPDIHAFGLSSREFAVRLLDAENVAVVPGTAFGSCGEGFVRCSYATGMEQLKEAVSRMARFVRTL